MPPQPTTPEIYSYDYIMYKVLLYHKEILSQNKKTVYRFVHSDLSKYMWRYDFIEIRNVASRQPNMT